MRINGIHDFAGEVARVRGGEAHPAETRDFRHRRQQLRKAHSMRRGVAVGVDVLPQQLNFSVAFGHQAPCFRENGGVGAAALRSARERHHAVSAGLVAALDDGEVGAERIVAAGEFGFKGLVVVCEPGHALVAGLELGQQAGQLAVAGRARHQVDVGSLREDFLAFKLRHAAQHRHGLLPRQRVGFEVTQARENFLLGFVADGAGVQHHQVGFFGRRCRVVALCQQQTCDFFRVVDIHLAAEGFNVERPGSIVACVHCAE